MSSFSFFPVEETPKLASLLQCGPEAEVLLSNQDFDAVYLLFAKHSHVLLKMDTKEIEKVYNLLIAIVAAAKQDDLAEIVRLIVAPIVQDNENASIKLNILSNLYNSLDASSHSRYTVFMSIIELAAAGNELDVVVPSLSQLEHFFVAWGVELDEKRRMLLLLSNVLGESDEYKIQAYEYLIRYLKTYPLSKNYPTQVQDTAIKAVHASLTLPSVTNFTDLMSLGAVKALSSSHKILMQLVEIFVDGSVQDYSSFEKSNAKFLKDQHLDHDVLLKKIRLLSLATAATEYVDNTADSRVVAASTKDMPFSVVVSTLGIKESEVEEWIVTGIRSGLIDGRIDQVKKVVCVSRATQRVFGEKQWDLVEERFCSWAANLKELLTVLQSAKAAAVHAQQQH